MVDSLEHWRHGGAVQLAESDIFVRRAGALTAPVLLLIHGFRRLPRLCPDLGLLVACYRLLTLDMLGFGFSAKRAVIPTPADQADPFESFLRAEGLHRLPRTGA